LLTAQPPMQLLSGGICTPDVPNERAVGDETGDITAQFDNAVGSPAKSRIHNELKRIVSNY